MTTLIIDDMGGLRHIYSDELQQFDRELGEPETRRASHVEPNNLGGWYVDLRPVGGPVIPDFATRSAALRYEVQWINQHGVPEVQ